MIEKLSKVKQVLTGKDIYIKRDITIACEMVGGDSMDACCVYMDTLQKKETPIIYSAGIGDQINFELELFQRIDKLKNLYGGVYAIDPTPKSLEFLAGQDLPSNFFVLPYALSATDREIEFMLPESDGWVSGSVISLRDDGRKLKNKIKVQGRSLKSLMEENGHEHIDLLKLDIEGSEFEVLDDVLQKKLPIEQMCIDCHHFLLDNSKEAISHLVNELRRFGYKIFYVDTFNKAISCIKDNLV